MSLRVGKRIGWSLSTNNRTSSNGFMNYPPHRASHAPAWLLRDLNYQSSALRRMSRMMSNEARDSS